MLDIVHLTLCLFRKRFCFSKIIIKVACIRENFTEKMTFGTRRPASADRTACRQFQATGQPVSRTQASDAMTSRLPRYEANCEEVRGGVEPCFVARWKARVEFLLSVMELLFSERELTFTFAICYRPSVCRLSSVCLSSVCLSVVCL